ncbi:hypothetical protein R5W24_005443 [Gemmata sp. JC717]|uniref:hypothetical protein n=1 Tax=Gemmata algarum TaxID=2975278 RepID=UPI0021BAE5A5|nr:hypothetical protein [Gemmata algarum]MDY3556280.1 hypothetical protein [Gemmata algarum]
MSDAREADGDFVHLSLPAGAEMPLVPRHRAMYLTVIVGAVGSRYTDADGVTGNTVLTQVEYGCDASGNVPTGREQFHDTTTSPRVRRTRRRP